MISFAELTKQVHLINDLILSDMICDGYDFAEETVILSKHLLATKYWFARISFANKKRYLLALLQDVRSAWALSLLLKSLWNCRLKDAVMSVSEPGHCLSSFDQVPMDHNRTALPVATLAQVMKNDRTWFLSLDPESQALVLSELLTVAGGPAMCEILHRAQILYDRYREQLMPHMQECAAVQDADKMKNPHTKSATSQPVHVEATTKAEKELEANLATWNATIKAMKDSLKLEEFEINLSDGTKRTVWKVNRPKPDIMETVDFVQLLPSAVGKRILSFLPRAQLGDYAKVNKYWAYLVDEYRAELAARVKIDIDFTKMNDILLKHDVSLDDFMDQSEPPFPLLSDPGGVSVILNRLKLGAPSCKASEKSGGAYSLRHISEKLLTPKTVIAQKPIRNMADLYERVEQRGAIDEHIWEWCENIEADVIRVRKRKYKKQGQTSQQASKKQEEGILILGNVHFPCPLMKLSLVVPLEPPLYKDPAKLDKSYLMKSKRHPDNTVSHVKAERVKRYNLWTRDASSLFKVLKIPSYNFSRV
ncbi:unnamed protein product [Arctia plantaginis]|uniref:F-box domain-containing protein n=1 Tax=Arctia plantaginis TaxID=874455 RepID=A0A8S0YYT1_ARCPL|nr:unnamed protein product [Arctia plantaginis]